MMRYDKAVDARNDILRLAKYDDEFSALALEKAYADVVAETLSRATTYYVTTDMTEVIHAASDSLPDFQLDAQDLPAPAAFVYLEECIPLTHYDESKEMLIESSIRVIGWIDADYLIGNKPGTKSKRVFIFWMSSRDDWGAFWQWMVLSTNDLANRKGFPWDDETTTQWVRENTPSWVIDALHQQEYEFIEAAKFEGSYVSAKFLFTLWMLMRQRVTEEEDVDAPRAARKRYERKHGTKHGKVTVVYLRGMRHYAGKRSAGEGQRLSVRFPVSGHWRNQWYPSIQGHKPIWIAPYVKGPDDAPFKVSDTVKVFKDASTN